MRILGIETSCDETSLAVLELTARSCRLVAHTVSSQVKLHAKWGGVVPELAARKHTETIIPLLHETLGQAKIKPAQIDALAVTAGPGLITALHVGVETAKALAYTWRKPLIGVNHIAAHIVSPFLTTEYWSLSSRSTTWPAVALVVSGGHTELYKLTSLTSWKLLGKTLDDAAGEAFDKVGKLLKLPYPGGPRVSKLAESGNNKAYAFPRPMLKSDDLNFSFAGLKTAVRYAIENKKLSTKQKADVCASFQQAAVEVLVAKTIRAAKKIRARTVLISGGVSANRELRKQLTAATKLLDPSIRTLYPDLKFTGDNAAMIALAGALEAKLRGLKVFGNGWKNLSAQANWELW